MSVLSGRTAALPWADVDVGAFGFMRGVQLGSGLNAVSAEGRVGDISYFDFSAGTKINATIQNDGPFYPPLIFDYHLNGGELRLYESLESVRRGSCLGFGQHLFDLTRLFGLPLVLGSGAVCNPRRCRFAAFSRKGNTLNLHVYYWPGSTATIAGLQTKAKSAKLLATGQNVAFKQDTYNLAFTGLPEAMPQSPITTHSRSNAKVSQSRMRSS
jgi:hypothetical protein